jgi:hypothetical protein
MDKMSPQTRVARDNAARYVQFLLTVADQTLAENAAKKDKPFLTENDTEIIEFGKRGLNLHAEPFIDMLCDEEGFDAHRALLFLSKVMEGAFMVGTRCARRVLEEARTDLMRDQKKPGDETRIAALDAAILACVNYDRSVLNTYRDNMVPKYEEVIQELAKHIDKKQLEATKPGWPKLTTVVKRISSLKKSELA